MPQKELETRRQILKINLLESKVRIRRYTLDPRLQDQPGDKDNDLRVQADNVWKQWLEAWDRFQSLPAEAAAADLSAVEKLWLELDRNTDLIQRELISKQSYTAGARTVFYLTLSMLLLILFYLASHGVRSLDFSTFEPWPEWGPMKYGEVACWSLFGVLCYLLFLASNYLARRDFDVWYQPWYAATAIRAPFFSIILMMIILEFAEWYGEGTWIQSYLLEEGNKFYFIVFMSFCLGLASYETAGVMRQLSEGVIEFVSCAVGRISQRLSLAVTKTNAGGK